MSLKLRRLPTWLLISPQMCFFSKWCILETSKKATDSSVLTQKVDEDNIIHVINGSGGSDQVLRGVFNAR